MTNKATLLALADRCEKAEGPDAELDEAIAVALGWVIKAGYDWRFQREFLRPDGALVNAILRHTASLDAAMTLVPEGWHVTHSGEGRFLTRGTFVTTLETWGVEQADDGSDIHTTPQRRHGVAETFPLALCAAALRARASRIEARSAATGNTDAARKGESLTANGGDARNPDPNPNPIGGGHE